MSISVVYSLQKRVGPKSIITLVIISTQYQHPLHFFNLGGGLKPLDINGARKLQLVTEMYQETKYGSGGANVKGGGARRRSATIHMGNPNTPSQHARNSR